MYLEVRGWYWLFFHCYISYLILRQGLSLTLELTNSTRMTGQQASAPLWYRLQKHTTMTGCPSHLGRGNLNWEDSSPRLVWRQACGAFVNGWLLRRTLLIVGIATPGQLVLECTGSKLGHPPPGFCFFSSYLQFPALTSLSDTSWVMAAHHVVSQNKPFSLPSCVWSWCFIITITIDPVCLHSFWDS